MRAGRLRKRVTFQSESRSSDGGGGSAITWGNDLEVYGEFAPQKGREQLEAGRLEAALAGILRVRSSSETRAIDETWTVVIGSDRYQIRSIINPDQKNDMLEMTVEWIEQLYSAADAPGLDFSNADNSQYLPLFEDV